MIACVAPIPLVALYFKLTYALQPRSKKANWLYGGEKRRALANRYRQPLYLLTAVLWALATSLHYANRVADDLEEGKGRRVHVELIADTHSLPSDTMPALLLGTTQKYLFLYDPTRQVTSIIPTSNVARIRVERRRTATAPPTAPAARGASQ